jgi:hypothetical protein
MSLLLRFNIPAAVNEPPNPMKHEPETVVGSIWRDGCQAIARVDHQLGVFIIVAGQTNTDPRVCRGEPKMTQLI